VEHRSGNWKQLFIMPFPKHYIIFGKFIFLLATLMGLYLIFFLSVPLAGYILGLIKPNLGFLAYSFPFAHFSGIIAQSFCAVLGLLGLQFLLAWLFSNYTYPIIAGITTTVVFSTAAIGWSKSVFIPYAFPVLHVYLLREQLNPAYWFGIPAFYWVSILTMLICLIATLLSLRLRRHPF
jgi:hypothetical protein